VFLGHQFSFGTQLRLIVFCLPGVPVEELWPGFNNGSQSAIM
jgi:hypothetical protein